MRTRGAGAAPHLVFVYGTLKRGAENHHQLAGQRFVGAACTVAGYRLYRLQGYPGMVRDPACPTSVTGEVWAVDAAALSRLDDFEGVGEGLYERVPVELQPPFASHAVSAYLYLRSTVGCESLGHEWAVVLPRDP